jgi:iron complex outermembrane receptor protein
MRSAISLAILASFALAPLVTSAQQAAQGAQTAQGTQIGEVVVTGTRKAGVSPMETLSPVDEINGDLISNQGSFDMTDSLTKLVASLNTQRYPIADGTAFVRPVSLRNLSPDHTLVLVNGSREHRSALVNLQLAPLGTVNQGAQGVDWSRFPAAAIERVEVLRDGASAQYGSDAIAGVVNVILKKNNHGLSFSGQYGEYSESDGARYTISGNLGLPLAADGFVNLSAEYSESDETSRGVPREDALAVGAIVGTDLVPEEGLGQRWGDPNVEALKFMVNAGIPFGNGMEFYGHANYMDNTTISDFFYRDPVIGPPTSPQAAGITARTTLMIDSINNATSAPTPDGLPDPASAALVSSITGQGLNPANYLTADGTSPSGWSLLNPIHTLFPGGYNPDFGADITDFGVALGLRGEISSTLTWDVHGRYAENEVDYKLSVSINPSLGDLSPTTFKPGKLTQEESGVNLDFVKTFENSPLNLAFGAEYRNETYKIGQGDDASVVAGPTAAVFGVGSDGFQGFPAESSGSFKSDSYAGYIDLETDLTDRLSGAVALRYEDYDEFGDTFDWKVSGRFKFTDTFAIRATANTGFRAPTPGQVNTLNVTTTSDSSGNLIPNGTYPVNNPIAVALGAVPLNPEESESYTAGLVWTPSSSMSITADYYHIKIDDRIALLTNTIGPAQVALLTAAGIPNANLLLGSNANFFVNGFDSKVDGVDLAFTGSYPLGGGNLLVDLRHNYNQQKVENVQPNTINASRVYDLENQVPENETILTFDYTAPNAFSGTLRLNYYGGWSTTGGLFSPGDASDKHDYDSEILVDLEARYTFAERFTITVGGENIFDTFPGDEQDGVSQALGARYALTSPFGFNGAFYYARLSASF